MLECRNAAAEAGLVAAPRGAAGSRDRTAGLQAGERARRSISAVPTVYPIADYQALGGEVLDAVREWAAAGAEWIQVRAKGIGDRRLLVLLEAACEIATAAGARIWVNDRPDLAALTPVAGVHLGQDDLPPAAARAILGPGVWIGRSTHTEEQVSLAAQDPEVDVVALGPVFGTVTKPDAEPVIGLELLRRARRVTAKPLVAIGGIDATNIDRALAAGADCVAVIGAVCQPPLGEGLTTLMRAAEGKL